MSIHVLPIDDVVVHDEVGTDCICGPDVEWADPETGETYSDGPIVVHHSLDGRERFEDDVA